MAYTLIEKLFANQDYSEEVEVLGRKITFRALSAKDEDEIVRTAGNGNFLSLLESRKVPTLARAVVAIDGQRWEDFPEIKQRIVSLPGTTVVGAVEQELAQAHYTEEVVTALYLAYTDFRQKVREKIDASLKKSSIPQSPATVG